MKENERGNDHPSSATRFLPVCFLLAFFLAAGGSFAAAALPGAKDSSFPVNFRDIPGITQEEIQALEKVLATRKTFTFGVMEGTECFYQDDGSLDGYTVMLVEWFRVLFGISFELKTYEWGELRKGIRSGSIDFTSDFDPDNLSGPGLIVSRVVRERSVKFVSRADDFPLSRTASQGPLRVAFLRYSAAGKLAVPHLRKQYGDNLTLVSLDDRTKVADMLREGKLDMFIADDAWTAIFLGQPGLAIDTLHPLLYKNVCVLTGNPELAPFIPVFNRLFTQKSRQYLYDLHREGRIRFLRKAFTDSLNDAERAYYDNRMDTGIPVPIGASPTNYPVEFYNESEKRWDGIAFDILAEISEISGLTFRPVEFAKDNWPYLLKMLRNGDPNAPMLLDVGYNEIRARDFLFADRPYMLDHYALISASSLKNLRHDEVLYHRVGLLQDSMFAEVFQQWFPSHGNTRYFSGQYEEFKALEKGEIDLFMLSQLHFSYITNFLKRTNFKINMVFEDPLRTGFGFGKGQKELCGIISKAQSLIDTQSIVRRWEYSIFDYQSEEAQARALMLMFSSVLLLSIIALLALLLFQRRREGKRLRALVTERTRELAEQVRATRSASEAKSRFLAGMSHDMRTPLNAIVGLSKLALTSDADAVDRKSIRSIHNAGLTLLSLVNDLLDISKIEAGRYELSPVDYETPSLIGDTIAMNIVRIAEKPIAFKLTLDETLPARLHGDDLRVRQIFNNLLSNAFKYTERGEVEWTLSWRQEGVSVWLVSSVRDTGIGIHPESLKEIFSDYSRIIAGTVRKSDSTGLGLPIALNLAKLMDGELTVTSEYGKGSIFSVRIRQGFVDAEAIGPELAQRLRQFQYSAAEESGNAHIAYRDLSHAAVLVVDDVESNLEVATGMMRRYRLRVDCATGGRQAIDRVRTAQTRYDLIFMDHMMPEMDGIESLRGIRAVGTEYARAVPVIALTANAVVGNEQRFLEKGFQAFLPKPLDMWQLDATLQRFIRDETQNERSASENSGERAEEKSAPLPLLRNADIPGLNVEAALQRFAGDASAYLSVLQSWVRHTPVLLEQVRAVSGETLDDYAVAIHGIKGSCLGIGAASAGRKAEELEAATINGDFAFITAHNAECVETLERLLADLSGLLAKVDQKEKPLKEAPDAETLARLKAACAEYDIDGVDAALKELTAYRYRNRQELVDWLHERAQVMEFARMAEVL